MKNLITCLVVCVLSGTTFADTWTVDDDGKADYATIQDAIEGSINADTEHLHEFKPHSVILKFRSAASVDKREVLLSEIGGTVTRSFSSFPDLVVITTNIGVQDAIALIARRTDVVEFAQPDYILTVDNAERDFVPGSPRNTPGDECSIAIQAVEGANPFDTTLMTPSTPDIPVWQESDVCPGTFLTWANSQDAWFEFVPDADGLVSFSLCDAASYDTSMALYAGDCDTLVACNGDASGETGCQTFYSAIYDFPVSNGTHYYIRIGGYSGSTGTGTLNIWMVTPEIGACCMPDSSCVDEFPSACLTNGGEPQSGMCTSSPCLVFCSDELLPNDPYYTGGDQWGIDKIKVPGAWENHTGSTDFRVAIIDTGIDYNHPDLINNIWTNPGEIPGDGLDNDGNGYIDDVHGYNFNTNNPDPMDGHGHGTHIAGTVGAETNNNLGMAGVMWECKLVAVKVLGDDGVGSTVDIIDGMHYCFDEGIPVINYSLGSYGDCQPSLDACFSACRAAGIIPVVGAGNSNVDACSFCPANSSHTIAVMATSPTDEKAYFSNYGECVDIAAPGLSILSTMTGAGYSAWSGTAMAAPFVTGAAALLYSSVTNEADAEVADWVVETLISTADPVPILGDSVGRLNLCAAMQVPWGEGCEPDLDNDGEVAIEDLLYVLDQWGHANSTADLNFDQIVDILDVLIVIGAWGPCP